jgi:hypothetical protein
MTKIENLKKYNIRPQKEFEKKLADLREKRNCLLSETDYLILPDYPVPENYKNEIFKYRQLLRDFTDNITIENIDNAIFPQKPAVIEPPVELIEKIKIVESAWFNNTKALTDLYNPQYQKIKGFLLNNNKSEAIQYMTDLTPAVATELKTSLTNLIALLQEIF